ncbi:MAG: hypothetical protein ONB24_08685, partial [candidate division KSB1 bacterium]|nr:hypothetical protein [candidate division KSB1 bacterium]
MKRFVWAWSLFFSIVLRADVAVFTNMSGDGNWHNPANWSTNRVPGPNDHVDIPEGKRCSFSGSAMVAGITVRGELWALHGGSILTNEFKVARGGEITLDGELHIDRKNKHDGGDLKVTNEGVIHGAERAMLAIGDPKSGDSQVSLRNLGGEIKDVDFCFAGKSISLDGGIFRVKALSIVSEIFRMLNGAIIEGTSTREYDVIRGVWLSFRANDFEVGNGCTIFTRDAPPDNPKIAGDVIITAERFANWGWIYAGGAALHDGSVIIGAQLLVNKGRVGKYSGLNKTSLAQRLNNVTLCADSVFIERVDGMITADTLRVYGRQIMVKIQNGVGIGLMTGVDFYTTVDGTIDFTQTTYFNAIAGGYIKRIFSNHVIPSEQWKLQSVFGGPVSVFPADATLLQASATLAPSFGYAGTRDTLQLYLQNQSMTAVRLAYTVSSNLGWAPALNDSTTRLAPFATVAIAIPYAIPPETSRGTADTVKVTVTIGRRVVAKASAAISCLSRSSEPWTVSQIVVTPVQVNLVVGQQQQFTAAGMN